MTAVHNSKNDIEIQDFLTSPRTKKKLKTTSQLGISFSTSVFLQCTHAGAPISHDFEVTNHPYLGEILKTPGKLNSLRRKMRGKPDRSNECL